MSVSAVILGCIDDTGMTRSLEARSGVKLEGAMARGMMSADAVVADVIDVIRNDRAEKVSAKGDSITRAFPSVGEAMMKKKSFSPIMDGVTSTTLVTGVANFTSIAVKLCAIHKVSAMSRDSTARLARTTAYDRKLLVVRVTYPRHWMRQPVLLSSAKRLIEGLHQRVMTLAVSPFGHVPYPLANSLDHKADAGLFGPDSVSWHVLADQHRTWTLRRHHRCRHPQR